MNVIEVADVHLSKPGTEQLWGHYLDRPVAGSQTDGQALELSGWVLGRSVPAVAVEILHDEVVIRRTPVQVHRPDLAAAFPQVPGAERSGFRTRLSLHGAKPVLTLRLQAVLADQQRVQLATLQLRWHWWEDEQFSGTPVVSVIIPCYNQAHFLAEAIESVVRQTYPHVEIVVVDDGSADNTAAVAARYPGVRYIQQTNRGLAGARNTGLQRSNGIFLVFLDADDRLLPHALETGLQALNTHPEAAFVYGHCRFIAFDGSPLPTPEPTPVVGNHYMALLRSCYIWMPAVVMYRRAVFRTVGQFDRSVSACADYDLYLRVARQASIVCHHKVVAEYRRHGANMTHKARLMLQTQSTVLRRQARFIKGKPDYEEAYRSGIRYGQQYFGEPLAEEARAQLHHRAWPQFLPALLTLLRYYPQGLISLLLGPWQPRRTYDVMYKHLHEIVRELEALQSNIAALQGRNQKLDQKSQAVQQEIVALRQLLEAQPEVSHQLEELLIERDEARRERDRLRQILQEQAERFHTLAARIEALSIREGEL